MLAATATAPEPAAAPPAPPAAPGYVPPKTWGDVFDSQKAFIAAVTPVMAVALGVISAVVTAMKCPGMKKPVRAERPRERSESCRWQLQARSVTGWYNLTCMKTRADAVERCPGLSHQLRRPVRILRAAA